jgi:hypothetical protein
MKDYFLWNKPQALAFRRGITDGKGMVITGGIKKGFNGKKPSKGHEEPIGCLLFMPILRCRFKRTCSLSQV